MPPSCDANRIDRVTAALQDWRQGDVTFDAKWFNHAAELSVPLSDAAREAAKSEQGIQVLTTEVAGLVIVSQTCDIVRAAEERSYVDVSPLIRVSEQQIGETRGGWRPSLLYIPGVADRFLVGDLDRTMTVEKAIVAAWKRIAGASTDAEARAIGQALSRKRSRFAFPDDFVEFTRPFQRRLVGKHNRASAEGEALRALREIRVTATPNWEAPEVKLFFHFIRGPENEGDPNSGFSAHCSKWLSLLPPKGRFIVVEGVVSVLFDLRADEYVASDLLDLDHLSSGR